MGSGQLEAGAGCALPNQTLVLWLLQEEDLALDATLILEEPEENRCCQDVPAAR